MNQYTFTDIIKKSILQLDTFKEVSLIQVIVTLSISLILGLFIFLIYKKSFNGVVYSHNFNIILVLMTLITSLIIITVSSNIVLSLGMVGALSIVRFRTAIKDPVDIMYLFWAIAVGIASGAKLYSIAVVGTIFIGITILILLNHKSKKDVFLLVINYTDVASDEVKGIIDKFDYRLKTKNVSSGVIELTIELKVVRNSTGFVNILSNIEGVKSVVLVNYNGDYS